MEQYYNIDNMKTMDQDDTEAFSDGGYKTCTITDDFRNYLQQFRKVMPDMSNNESFRMALSKYNNLYMNNKTTARQTKNRAVRENLADDNNFTGNGYNWNTAFLDLKRLMDDEDNKFEAYQGMNFKCCPKKKQAKPKACCPKKKKQCPKPKPKCCPKAKPACQQNQSKQKCPKSKPACPDPCCKKPKPCCPQPPPPFCPPSNSCPAQPCPLPPCGKPKCCGRPKCCPEAQACPKQKKCPKKQKCPKC